MKPSRATKAGMPACRGGSDFRAELMKPPYDHLEQGARTALRLEQQWLAPTRARERKQAGLRQLEPEHVTIFAIRTPV